MMEGSVAALHNSTFLPPQLRLCGLPSTALIRRPSARTLHALSPSCDLSRSYPQGSPLRQCSLLRVPHELANSRLGCSEPKRGAPLVKSVAAASDGAADPANLPQASDAVNETGKTLQLGLLFGLWYLFNIYFNIYNKQGLLRLK